ncbi:MAG: gamma carbonic anhydrase family protein [Moraxellaceae bacterium]|nr:gamma carbonic anhydrase family protein [Moraxellaceae bacterium]
MIYSLDDRQLQTDGDYWIADNATVIGAVVLKNNASVWFNVVIRADNDTITIGESTNIQDGSVLHTDSGVPLTVGNNVTVGHKVMLHGCTIGDNTLIGINAVVLNHAKIGKNCIIGANALITERQQIPDNSLVVGSPAKVVKTISDAQAQMLQMSALHYVQNFKRYQTQLKPNPAH